MMKVFGTPMFLPILSNNDFITGPIELSNIDTLHNLKFQTKSRFASQELKAVRGHTASAIRLPDNWGGEPGRVGWRVQGTAAPLLPR